MNSSYNAGLSQHRLFTSEDVVRCYIDVQQQIQRRNIPNPRRILAWDIEYIDPGSLLAFLDYYLFRRLNDFIADNDSPMILDCGANIGYTVLNYKRLYPNARIIAFEPDPSFLPVLQRNLMRNGAHDVRVVGSAVWTSNGMVPWISIGSDGSKIADTASVGQITVNAIDLREYVNRTIDLLKLDVEGSEYAIIDHLGESLQYVKNILVECHIDQNNIGQFAETLHRLWTSGFIVNVATYGYWRDLVRRPVSSPLYSEQYALVSGTRQPAHEASSDPTLLPYYGIAHELELMNLRSSLQQKADHQLQSEREGYSTALASLLGVTRQEISRVDLLPPFRQEDLNCWTISIPKFSSAADQNEDPLRSKLLLFEDGRLLGPAHAVHDEIRKIGRGCYSHWTSALYFSTSDNSDPNINGRRYTAFFPE
jgi:FkbM family methyltransferase